MANISDAPLKQVVVFSIGAVSLWSGRAKLQPEDLGDAADDLPPAAIASLGSKALFPRDELKKLQKVKRSMARVLASIGTKFLNGYAIANADAEFVAAELNKLCTLGNQIADTLITNFESTLANWWQENPDWKHILSAGTPERDYVRNRIRFDWDAYLVESPENASLAEKLAGAVSGMGNNLFAEVAGEAQVFVSKSLKTDRNDATQRTVKPLQRLAEKLKRLGFLDHHAWPVADVCEKVLTSLPAVGKISDGDYIKMIRVAYLLADIKEMRAVALRILGGESVDEVLKTLIGDLTATEQILSGQPGAVVMAQPSTAPAIDAAQLFNAPAATAVAAPALKAPVQPRVRAATQKPAAALVKGREQVAPAPRAVPQQQATVMNY